MDNILELHRELMDRTYHHGGYQGFKINDPKPRDIHKASVRDRLLHHAIYRILYPPFDTKFIFDSYSCRRDKGTHRALDRFHEFAGKVSKNHTRTVWILKCDIRKFFANIDQKILLDIFEQHIEDKDVIWLLQEVVQSFETAGMPRVGLPLGNLTSQLFVNVYMDVFDQFVKRTLKVHYYIRYADDFVVLHDDKDHLEALRPQITTFLKDRLHLELHPDKISIATIASGIDFLGWIHFPHHRVLRTATKRRMLKNLKTRGNSQSIASYTGMLSYGNTHKLAARCFLDKHIR